MKLCTARVVFRFAECFGPSWYSSPPLVGHIHKAGRVASAPALFVTVFALPEPRLFGFYSGEAVGSHHYFQHATVHFNRSKLEVNATRDCSKRIDCPSKLSVDRNQVSHWVYSVTMWRPKSHMNRLESFTQIWSIFIQVAALLNLLGQFLFPLAGPFCCRKFLPVGIQRVTHGLYGGE